MTLILRKSSLAKDFITGGQNNVGIRVPAQAVALLLLKEFEKLGGHGICAPSANKFGHVSPTTAQHVRDEFETNSDNLVEAILDGGQSDVGIESTILDLSRMSTHGPVLLRPGHVSATDIAKVIGTMPRTPDAAAPRASGTLDAHYAPHTPVAIIETSLLIKTLEQLNALGRKVALIHRSTYLPKHNQTQCQLPLSADGYAHDLYAALREMDATGADIILVEALPREAEWQGVNDRLQRAAHDSQGVLSRLLHTN